jgi:hypothetical protein
VGDATTPLDPLLGPLADNGGPALGPSGLASATLTRALLARSPAIDAGANAVTGPPYSLATDQRGFARLAHGTVDIGAFEVQELPDVTALTPNSGPVAGGTSVTVTGSGFLPGAAVQFGTDPSPAVVVASPTSLTATAPPGSAGAVDVHVVNPDSQSSPANPGDVFTYLAAPPTVTAVTPSAGPTNGGSTVTLVGTGFLTGAQVFFGADAGFQVVVVSGSTITALDPVGIPGVVDVTVVNPDGQTSAVVPAAEQFTYLLLDEVHLPLIGDQAVNEGTTFSLQALASDTAGNPLTYTAIGLPVGLSINRATGLIAGTVGVRAAGQYSITVTAGDGLQSATTSFLLTVADTTPPQLTSPKTLRNNEGDVVNLQVAIDAERFTARGLPRGLRIDRALGVIIGTIDPQAAGTYRVTVTGFDGPLRRSVTFLWRVADTTPPLLTNPGNQRNHIGDRVTLALRHGDADHFSATGLPPGLSIDPATGLISGTMAPGPSVQYPVTITAVDGSASTTVSFHWFVIEPLTSGTDLSGRRLTGRLLSASGDWYQYTADSPTGGTFTYATLATVTNPRGHLALTLYTPSGSYWKTNAAHGTPPTAEVTWSTAANNTTYFLQVRGSPPGLTYSIEVLVLPT